MLKKQTIRKRPTREIILGFDPGTQITGWGAVLSGNRPELINFGTIRPPRAKPLEIRLEKIYSSARELIEEIKPAVVVVEDPFVGKSAKAALSLGQARGILLLAAARSGIEVASYAPRVIKSATVGKGAASKEQVQFMVQRLLNLREAPTPLDASDALAVALCHIHRARMEWLGGRR